MRPPDGQKGAREGGFPPPAFSLTRPAGLSPFSGGGLLPGRAEGPGRQGIQSGLLPGRLPEHGVVV